MYFQIPQNWSNFVLKWNFSGIKQFWGTSPMNLKNDDGIEDERFALKLDVSGSILQMLLINEISMKFHKGIAIILNLKLGIHQSFVCEHWNEAWKIEEYLYVMEAKNDYVSIAGRHSAGGNLIASMIFFLVPTRKFFSIFERYRPRHVLWTGESACTRYKVALLL